MTVERLLGGGGGALHWRTKDCLEQNAALLAKVNLAPLRRVAVARCGADAADLLLRELCRFLMLKSLAVDEMYEIQNNWYALDERLEMTAYHPHPEVRRLLDDLIMRPRLFKDVSIPLSIHGKDMERDPHEPECRAERIRLTEIAYREAFGQPPAAYTQLSGILTRYVTMDELLGAGPMDNSFNKDRLAKMAKNLAGVDLAPILHAAIARYSHGNEDDAAAIVKADIDLRDLCRFLMLKAYNKEADYRPTPKCLVIDRDLEAPEATAECLRKTEAAYMEAFGEPPGAVWEKKLVSSGSANVF
ncbi:hypothetical protein HK101_002867 [Irineochytrium annulatum]|nr:hypothetical protein HK101_002867 [Irineochytrium annulatum]